MQDNRLSQLPDVAFYHLLTLLPLEEMYSIHAVKS